MGQASSSSTSSLVPIVPQSRRLPQPTLPFSLCPEGPRTHHCAPTHSVSPTLSICHSKLHLSPHQSVNSIRLHFAVPKGGWPRPLDDRSLDFPWEGRSPTPQRPPPDQLLTSLPGCSFPGGRSLSRPPRPPGQRWNNSKEMLGKDTWNRALRRAWVPLRPTNSWGSGSDSAHGISHPLL